MSLRRRIPLMRASELEASERARHEKFMALAVAQARRNPSAPFGAIVVDRETGDVACRGVNQAHLSPTLHGEIATLNACARTHSDLEWVRTAMYTTAEPCPMCAAAIAWAGIGEVIFGTSIDTLITLGVRQIRMSCQNVLERAEFYDGRIVADVLCHETDGLYRDWARERV